MGTKNYELYSAKMEAEKMNTTSFREASKTMYLWSLSPKIFLEAEKSAENMKTTSFGDTTQTMYWWSRSLKIVT
jgi:hypothetical protein